MDSQSIDELVTLRARVRELEAKLAGAEGEPCNNEIAGVLSPWYCGRQKGHSGGHVHNSRNPWVSPSAEEKPCGCNACYVGRPDECEDDVTVTNCLDCGALCDVRTTCPTCLQKARADEQERRAEAQSSELAALTLDFEAQRDSARLAWKEVAFERSRAESAEGKLADHFAKVHGPESITACEAVTRLGEYAAKLQEAEKERDAWKGECDRQALRISQQAEALRAAREYAAKNQYETGGIARAALQVVVSKLDEALKD
jgi:hypothetical protein